MRVRLLFSAYESMFHGKKEIENSKHIFET